MNDLLKFQFGNAKLANAIAVLNLPAGWSCPGAEKCLSKFDPKLNKIVDGPNIDYRCFGAMEERYPNVRNLRWHNFNLIKAQKSLSGIVNLIESSLPISPYIRPHSSAGDFFNENYFVAWLNVASNHPSVVFYTYTKMPHFLVKYKDQMPSNFNIVSSFGGKHDDWIVKNNLQFARVFNSVEETNSAGLEIDTDDSHAYAGKKSFALLIHGMQPVGTPAAAAWNKLKKAGNGYSQKKKLLKKVENARITSANINIKVLTNP